MATQAGVGRSLETDSAAAGHRAAEQALAELAGEPYLQKPFTPEELLEHGRRLLQRRRLRLLERPE